MKYLQVCMLSIILYSCAVEESERGGDRSPPPVVQQKHGTPIFLKLADPDCTTPIEELGEMVVTISIKGKPEDIIVDFTGYSGKGLKGPGIDRAATDTVWNLGQARPQNSKMLKICRKEGGYPRDSLENVGLAAAIGIIAAHHFHSKLNGSKPIPDVDLLIQPDVRDPENLFNRLDTRGPATLVDNLFWEYSFSDKRNYVVILPYSKERGPEYAMWERPAAVAHEFGHHVLAQYAPSIGLLTKTQDRPESARVFAAFGEAFADIFAHHTFRAGADAVAPEGVGFLPNRAVNNRYFWDGTEKILSSTAIAIYLGKREADKIVNTNRMPPPDFTEEHTVGAILAYTINHKLDQETSTRMPHRDLVIGSKLLRLAMELEADKKLSQKSGTEIFEQITL